MRTNAAVGAPMAAVPGVSRFWTAATTNDSYLLTWENFSLGRVGKTVVDSDYPAGMPRQRWVSAQIELFTTGDFIMRSNEVERQEISDEEILRRMRVLYRPSCFEELKKDWDKIAAFPESAAFRMFRESFLERMWSASAFMKTLKQHFTMSFNGRREHAGTMWEGRFHSRIVIPVSRLKAILRLFGFPKPHSRETASVIPTGRPRAAPGLTHLKSGATSPRRKAAMGDTPPL